MLKLCGFHLSNYHNKVRIALLEKGVPFEEDATCSPSQKDEWLARGPARAGAQPVAKGRVARALADRQGADPRSRGRPAHRRIRGDLRIPRGGLSAEAAPAEGSVRARQGARARDVRRAAPRAGGAAAVSVALLRRRTGVRGHDEVGGEGVAEG